MAILLPFYAKHVLHVGQGGLAAIMAGSGAGAFLGSLYLLVLPRKVRIGSTMIAHVVIALALSVLGSSRHLALSVAAASILSFSSSSSLGVFSIIIQETVPDALRGRVMSLYSLAFTGLMPFAVLAVAQLADGIGMRRELLWAALLYGICGALFMPILQRTDTTGETDPGTARHFDLRIVACEVIEPDGPSAPRASSQLSRCLKWLSWVACLHDALRHKWVRMVRDTS